MNHNFARRPLLTRLALALVLALLALPATLHAQDASPLVFTSGTLPSASSPGREIVLTLNADGTAVMNTDYMNEEDPIVEVGGWTSDEADQTLTLTLTGTADEEYAEAVEIVFAVTDSGLEAVEYDETVWGSEGLSLVPGDAADTAAAPPAEEEEAAAEPGGRYVSGTLPAASSPGREITLLLGADGAATMTTDYLNDEEPIEEIGTWEYDAAEGAVALTLSGRPDRDYEVPVEILFSVEADGVLVATEYDEELFGSEGLTLSPAEAAESAAGVYISDILPAADTPGQVVLMMLYPDQSIQASTYYLNGEEPIQEIGTWEESGNGSVTVVVTGSIEAEYDVPQQLVFERDGDSLTYLSLTLNRLQAAELAQGAEPIAWYQTELMPAASSPGVQKYLVFFDDNTVQMISDFMNEEEPITELGEWVEEDDGAFTVTLTGRPDREYDQPDVIVFERDGETLASIDWDEEMYGSEGLVFTEQPLDALELGETPAAGATQGGDVSAGAPITLTESLTATDAVTETGAGSGAEAPGAESTAELPAIPAYEVPSSATNVYVSDVLPAADSPGRVVRLVLFNDGSVQMITDYLNGTDPVLELGSFADNGDGTLSVELVGQIDGLYATPVTFTFEQSDNGLVASEWDQTLYGSEALELRMEYPAE